MGLAVICSGQGAQAPDLFQTFPFTEKGLALQKRVLNAGCLEPEVAGWLANPAACPEDIFKNHFSQPLLCLYQMMVWAELSVPAPRFFAGYSLGELSAYGCAGALNPEDVVRLAGIRARLMDAAGAGHLVAVTGMAVGQADLISGLHSGHLAIVLGEDHCVVGCPENCGSEICEALLAKGAGGAVMLPVSVPSHTPLLDPAVEPFRKALETAPWKAPNSLVLAGVDATKVANREQMMASLPEQIHRTVRWDLVEQRLREAGCQVVLELGPGSQLAHAILGAKISADARSAGEFRTPEGISSWVQRSLQRFD